MFSERTTPPFGHPSFTKEGSYWRTNHSLPPHRHEKIKNLPAWTGGVASAWDDGVVDSRGSPPYEGGVDLTLRLPEEEWRFSSPPA
jgi:hypothetical protein